MKVNRSNWHVNDVTMQNNNKTDKKKKYSVLFFCFRFYGKIWDSSMYVFVATCIIFCFWEQINWNKNQQSLCATFTIAFTRKKTSSTISKLAWKGRMLHSKSKSIAANSPRLILALIQHGTRAQVIKMSSPLLLAPNSPLQIVFLFFFMLFFFISLHSPKRWAPVVYMCVYEERDSASHRMLINWSPVDNREEVCGHDSESFRWNGRCLITAAVSAVE